MKLSGMSFYPKGGLSVGWHDKNQKPHNAVFGGVIAVIAVTGLKQGPDTQRHDTEYGQNSEKRCDPFNPADIGDTGNRQAAHDDGRRWGDEIDQA